jgi:hypothetical protein
MSIEIDPQALAEKAAQAVDSLKPLPGSAATNGLAEWQELPPVESYADEPGAQSVKANGRKPPQDDPIQLLCFDLDAALEPILPESNLVVGVPREAYTLIAGALSSYKSTLLLYMMILRATGYDFLNLDRSMIASNIGPAVLIFYEDTDKRVLAKFYRILQSGHEGIQAVHGPKAARQFLEMAAKNIRRIPFTGCFRKTLVARIAGAVFPNEPMIEELLIRIREFAKEDVLIGLTDEEIAVHVISDGEWLR